MQRIFSGVQPTGNLHLGNYLGAIRNWVRLQRDYDCIFCIVDLHAITQWQEPAELRGQTREVTAAFLAAGIDARKHIVFNQSQVPAHAQLAWIFNCVARIGWLNRMTQFKEKAGKDRENASVGLYVYPNLMAADILVYKATHVPVGEDQKQHLELARDIAQKFNKDFGRDFFPLPEPLIFGAATRVMSLRDGTKKMSKSDASDYSRINMTDDADTVALKIRKAKTDPTPLPGPEVAAPRRQHRPGGDGRPAGGLQSGRHLCRAQRPAAGRGAGGIRRPGVLRLQGRADRSGGGDPGPDRRRDEAPPGRAGRDRRGPAPTAPAGRGPSPSRSWPRSRISSASSGSVEVPGCRLAKPAAEGHLTSAGDPVARPAGLAGSGS